MGVIYLVRHGQAAFGTADYDRLTALGEKQCRLLGADLVRRGVHIDLLIRGSLTRHRQSLEQLIAGAEEVHATPPNAGSAEICPALNEYDPQAVVEAFTGQPIGYHAAAEARDPQVVRQHFRVLRDALLAWAEGRTAPKGMPTFLDFQQQAVEVLRLACLKHSEGHVLIVTSGGPIGAIAAAALNAPPQTAVELNLRIRNASLSEFASTPKRHHLVMLNSVAHLESDAGLVSYA